MLLERESLVPRMMLYGIGVICLCIVMYMLGSTMTLWTLEFPFDQTDSPLLEGVSLPTTVSDLTPAMPVASAPEPVASVTSQLNEHGLLRPPNTAV